MTTINTISPIIRNYAEKAGKTIAKIPLKDNTDAYLMTNHQTCEIMQLKGDSIVGGKGLKTDNPDKLGLYLYNTVNELQGKAKKGVSVFGEYIRSFSDAHPNDIADVLAKILKV